MADLSQAAFRAAQPGGHQAGLVTSAGTLSVPRADTLFAMAELTSEWLNNDEGNQAVPKWYAYARAKLLRLSQGQNDSKEWMPQQQEILVVAPWRTRKEQPLADPGQDVRYAVLPGRVGERIWVCRDRQSGHWLYLGLERHPLLRVQLTQPLPPFGEAEAEILQFDPNDEQWTPTAKTLTVHDAMGLGGITDQHVVVQWTWTARRWEVVSPTPVAIVEVTDTTPDSDGFYPGQIVRWNSDTQTWDVVGPCKVLDINQT